MRHLNYNHLLYFWTIAREGSIARASEHLHLTPQTLSGQLKLLEESVGEPLFHRVGRGLVLSDAGELVKHYADEIFSIGAELAQRVSEKQPGSSESVTIGIVDSIPKLVAYRLLEPVFSMGAPIKLSCHEGALEKLLAELALHKIDMVLSDRPLPKGLGVKAYNHSLGSSSVGLFIQKKLAAKLAKKYPSSLNHAPFLLPAMGSTLRHALEEWFEKITIAPRVIAEFEDSALLKTFGAAGVGIFPAPSAIADEVEKMYNARFIGLAEGVSETFYAISPERKLKNAAVVQINEAAHSWLD
jgi:LysR family transcriptional activator of nhaA